MDFIGYQPYCLAVRWWGYCVVQFEFIGVYSCVCVNRRFRHPPATQLPNTPSTLCFTLLTCFPIYYCADNCVVFTFCIHFPSSYCFVFFRSATVDWHWIGTWPCSTVLGINWGGALDPGQVSISVLWHTGRKSSQRCASRGVKRFPMSTFAALDVWPP